MKSFALLALAALLCTCASAQDCSIYQEDIDELTIQFDELEKVYNDESNDRKTRRIAWSDANEVEGVLVRYQNMQDKCVKKANKRQGFKQYSMSSELDDARQMKTGSKLAAIGCATVGALVGSPGVILVGGVFGIINIISEIKHDNLQDETK